MTVKEKAQIAKKAKKAGVSMGEYLRRAAQSFRPPEDDKALEAMIDHMHKATEQADSAVEDALSFIEASNRRMAEMESQKKKVALWVLPKKCGMPSPR